MEDQLILVKCNHCSKTVKASRFNHHISHCLRAETTETVVRVKTETAPPVTLPPEQTQSSPSKSSSTKRKPATSATANGIYYKFFVKRSLCLGRIEASPEESERGN